MLFSVTSFWRRNGQLPGIHVVGLGYLLGSVNWNSFSKFKIPNLLLINLTKPYIF